MGENLTIAVAVGAGLLSFLSPCVLPLVPAYIGQLSAVAVVGRASGEMSRWLAVRHALAYVAGFGAVFTLLGVTATYVAGPLVDVLPLLRQVGGILLILLGLNLAGILRIPALDRSWRPLDAGAAGSLATGTGTVALGSPGAAAGGPGLGVPFLVIAAVYDRSPALIRPLLRHGRVVSVVGGLLVVFIGVAMLMDWLALLARFVPFNNAI